MANNSDFKKPFNDLFDLLPEVFQSQTNDSVFRNVFNRFLSKPEIERVNGIIGEAQGAIGARQLPEPTPHRQAFQLQPLLFTRIGRENTIASYVDILNELERLGVEDCRQAIWGSTTLFNWIPPVDIDKIINFRNYFWVDPINPANQPQYITIKDPCIQAQQRVSAYQLTLDTFGEEFPILGLDATADSFLISGDITSVFVEDFVFFVRESTNVDINDSFFTVVSSSYDEDADQTTIFVVEDFAVDSPSDGVVSIIENMFVFVAEQNCVCGGDVGWGVAPWDDNQVGTVLWTDGLLPLISHPTEAEWIIANGAPAVNDIWYDTTANELKQYDGGSFVTVQQNFSAVLALVTGSHFWDFTEGCVVEDNQWIQQNKWVHKNTVINFAAAKQAVQPILEYDPTVQLNKWNCTLFDWGYRESVFIPEFTDVDVSPTLNELIPFLYIITGGSEISFSQTHGDQTSVYVPGYQFRLLGDTVNDGIYNVVTSTFVNDQTVVSTAEAFVTISNALVPLQDETDYDGAGSNGVFAGGGGYVPLETINLSDGSTVEVQAVGAGVVTAFIVTASGSTSVAPSIPIPQISSSGIGVGFSLTPESNNIVAQGVVTPQSTAVGDPFRLYDEHWILLDTQESVPVTPRVDIPHIEIDALGTPINFEIFGPVVVGEYLTSEEVDPTAFLGPGTEYLYAMEITLTLAGVTTGTEFTFDSRMALRARTGENDVRVYVDDIRQYGQFDEVDTGGFVSGIVFDYDVPVNAIVRIEVGEPALEDIGRHSITVLTDSGLVTQSLIQYRRSEQVKTAIHQYPLFDIVNVDGTDAFLANHIFGYQISQDAPINQQTGLRITINDFNGEDDFVFEQLILQEDNGKMYAFLLGGEVQSIWRKGLNDEQYTPQYVDEDRNPVLFGDPDGFWEIPDTLYFNSEHENRQVVTFSELFSHFSSIVGEQNNIPGFILPGDTFYLQLTPNYGLGGLIKDHNLSYDTLLSSTYIDNVTPLGVIDFAHDAYQNSLNILKESYRAGAVDSLLNVSPDYIQDLSGQITETVITQYELNDALAFIYNDSNTYIPATDTGVKNWPATLPFIRMAFKQTPYLIEDLDQEIRYLVHHDGHRSVPELTAATKESIIQTTINTLDTRVDPPETFGQQSTLSPPVDIPTLTGFTTPRSGIYWYQVTGGVRTLYRFNVITLSDVPPIDVSPGAYWYDTLTDTLRQLSVALAWDPVTIVGDTIITAAWEIVDLDDILADIWLEVENRLFEAAPDLTELAFDVSALSTSTVSCPDVDAVTTEADFVDLYLQEAFGSWLRDQSITDPFSSDLFYDAVDPFTWNYKQSIFILYPSTGNAGTESGGWWEDLYNTIYLTPYPHLEPWKLQGFDDKPTWWDGEYEDTSGTRRWIYGHGTTAGSVVLLQDETDYDGAGSNGTFSGGFGGYTVADTITLSDGTSLTVDTEAAGIVTAFSVAIGTSTVVTAGDVITQASTTGGGTGFTLTPQLNNLTPAGMWENIRVGIVPAGELLPNEVISTGGAGEVGLTYTYFSVNIGDVPTIDGFDPDDVLPPFWDSAANGGSPVIRSTFDTFGQVVNPSADYQFGDRGPIEFDWTQTAQRLYDDLTVSFRMEPMEFFHDTFGEEFIDVAGLNVSPDLCKVYSHTDVRFHGDVVNTDQLLQFQGLNQWYVNFNRASGFDTTSSNFRPLWQNWSPLLSYQFGSVIDTSTFQIDNPNFDVNAKDYRITLKDSIGIENKTYEGINVSILGIPNRLLSADTESLWTLLIDTFSPVVRTLGYYNVRNYPFLADPLLNTFNLYQFNVAAINQIGGVFSLAGDQREAFTLSNDFTITGSTGNDSAYTAVSVVYDSTLHQTQISVGASLLDPTADGILTASYRELPWETGDAIELTSTVGLPSPFRASTPYYVIKISSTVFQLARTANDAQTGSPINVGSEGSGLHHVGQINYKFQVFDGQGSIDRTWIHYTLDKDSVLQLTPPTVQRGMQNLIDFIDGYSEFKVDEGFVFNADSTETDADLNKPVSWQTEIERFLDSAFRLRSFRDEQGEQFNVNTNPLTDELIFDSTEPTWETGQKVQILSYDGVVPTPLLQQSPYYVIRGLDRVQLALTRTDALLGNQIDILTGGTGRTFLQEYIAGKRTIESFEINPSRNNLWVAHDQGILSNVDTGRTVDIRDTQLITDQNGEKLTTEELAVFRQDKLSRIFVQNSSPDPTKPTAGQTQRDFRHISTANIFIDGTEHVMLFNDDSIEGFLIYDPFLGLNTKYFDVLFFRQDEFTQRPVVGGYILTSDDQLVRNMEASVLDLQQAYDTYEALETTDLVIEGRRTLGYGGAGTQDYLAELNLSPKTQFAFWRGFIQSKGSTVGIDAYVNSATFDGAEVDEYWAFKVADFGSNYEQEYPELKLVELDAQRTEKRFEFLDLDQERFEADDTFEGVFTTDLDRWNNQPNQAAVLANNQDTLYFEAEVTDVYRFFGGVDGSTRGVVNGGPGHAVIFRAPRYLVTEDIVPDTFTFAGADPNWKTGHRVQFDGTTLTNETVPQPIEKDRDYFIIRVGPGIVQVADTQDDANSVPPIPVDIKGTLDSTQDETDYDGAGANGTFTGGIGYSAGGIIEDQIQADFNGVGDNGTFTAGAGYAIGDTITLSNGTGTVTVDAVSAGAITAFTITNSTDVSFIVATLTQTGTSGVGAGFTMTPGVNNVKDKDLITLTTGVVIEVDQISVGTVTQFNVTAENGTGVEAGDVLTQISVEGAGASTGVGFTMTIDTNNFDTSPTGDPFLYDPFEETPVYFDQVFVYRVDLTTTPETVIDVLIEGADYDVVNSQLVVFPDGDPAGGYASNGFTPLVFGDEEYRMYVLNPAKAKLNPAKIIDSIDDIVISEVPIWDPRRNHQYHRAYNTSTIETNLDPAIYTDSLDAANVGANPWVEPETGEVWWDTASREWIPYHDKALFNLESRSQNWGRLSDWATIDLYQWTESDLAPSEWDAQAATETIDITIDPRVRKSGTAKVDIFRRERSALPIVSVVVSNAAVDANTIFIIDLEPGEVSVGSRIVFNTTEELPAPLVVGTFYFVVEADAPSATRGIRVSLTDGGDVIEIQPGAATVDVNNVAVTGSELTGLTNDFDTAGFQDVEFTVPKTLGSSTGLATGTSGYENINYSVGLAPGTLTGLGTGGSGTQTVDYNPGVSGATASGLVALTNYSATITVDGIPHVVFANGTNETTFTLLLQKINLFLVGTATAVISGGNIVITSVSTGTGSTVSIVDGGTFAPMFAATTNFSSFLAAIPGSAAPTFSATVAVDGGSAQLIEDTGSDLVTMQDVLDLINTDVTGVVATLVGQDIRITSTTTGNSSTVLVTDTGLMFSSMTSFVSIGTGSTGGISTNYSAEIAIDNGGTQTISVAGDDAQNYLQLLTVINQQLSGAEAALFGIVGSLRVASNSTGSTSTVDIADPPTLAPVPYLFPALTNFNAITSAPVNDGADATAFTTEIDTGFDSTLVTVIGNRAQTYTSLVTEVASQLPAATVNLVSGNIEIASGNNQVTISNDNLFANLTDFVQIFNTDTGDGIHNVVPPFQINWVQLKRVVVDVLPARDRDGTDVFVITGVFPNNIAVGDGVDIYVNGSFYQTQTVDVAGNIQLSTVDVLDEDFVTVVKEIAELTADESAFDPAVFDDGSNLVQRKEDYNFTTRNVIDDFGGTAVRFYFWVTDKTTRDPESSNPSLIIAERELETIPIPYVIHDKLLAQSLNQPLGISTPNLHIPGAPWRYSQAIVKGLAGIINDDNRYILRFTRDFTLRDELISRNYPSDATRSTIVGQTEALYNGAGSNGTFVGGTGHATGDELTMGDGSLFRVDAVSAGIVIAFTVIESGTQLVLLFPSYSQISTSGSGTGFAFTPLANNAAADISRVQQEPLDLKNLHAEWTLLREGQPFKIPRPLWDNITESVIGRLLTNPLIRVPSLEREFYDIENDTQTRFGFGEGQAFVNGALALATTLDDLEDANNDFSPVDINAFFIVADIVTEVGLIDFYDDIYNVFSVEDVNRIYFKILLDALSTKSQYPALFKTSWVSLEGTQLLQTEALLNG